MNIQKTKDGFTLIEILVAINVAFIAITLIISVYLILNKVFISGIQKIEEKNLINFSLNKLNNLLRKEDYFTIVAKKDTIIMDFSSNDKVIFTGKEINIKDQNYIKGLSEFTIKLHNFDKTYNILSSTNISFTNNLKIHSNDIKDIEVVLLKNNVIYNSIFITPLISNKRFNNI